MKIKLNQHIASVYSSPVSLWGNQETVVLEVTKELLDDAMLEITQEANSGIMSVSEKQRACGQAGAATSMF